MPTLSYGGAVNSTSMYTSDLPFFYCSYLPSMPTTNLAANGNRPIRIYSLSLASVSNGVAQINYQGIQIQGPRTFGNSGGQFAVYAARTGGTMYVGRETGGPGVTYYSDGDSQSGFMPGSLVWAGSPTAPRSLTATPSSTAPGAVKLSWTAPASDGGAALTAYQIYVNNVNVGAVGTTSWTHTGVPGTTYTYSIRARNLVTDEAGTQSQGSNTASAVAPGVPSEPRALSATASGTVTGRIALSWSAPETAGAGGITGYNIFRSGTQVGSTSGTGTSFTVDGLVPYSTYSFTIKARNDFADRNGSLSEASNAASAVAGGPPTAPSGLTAIADGLTPGKIDLSWAAPSTTGPGGITGYTIFYSTGAVLATLTGTGRTYSTVGLNPGQTYSFYIRARNALADAEGTQSDPSNIATATALGEPPAPTGLTATPNTAVPGRISLSWVPPAGGVTGYSVFEQNPTTLAYTLIDSVASPSYVIDGLALGTSHTYAVRTKNSYTDTLPTGYPGNYGGPISASATAKAGTDYTISTGVLVGAVSDLTNVSFNGSFPVTTVLTPGSFSYSKVGASIALVSAAGTVTNTTNETFNGTYVIASTTGTTFTYAVSAANIPATSVTGGGITNTTNLRMNGTYVGGLTINVGAKTVTYSKTGPVVAAVSVPVTVPPGGTSTVRNNTNTVYNGTGITITAVTALTISYTKVTGNLAESNAAGLATNTTNRDSYNGSFVVDALPSYNTFSYTTVGAAQSEVAVQLPPTGQARRVASPANLDIKYRSGWAG